MLFSWLLSGLVFFPPTGITIQETGIFDALVPNYVAVSLEDEIVYVGSFRDGLIHLYRFDGSRIRTIAGNGQGPDQVSLLRAIWFRHGRLYAVDSMYRKVAVYDPEGKFVRQFQPDRMFFGRGLSKPIIGGWLFADKENLNFLDQKFENPKVIVGKPIDPNWNSRESFQKRQNIYNPAEMRLIFDVSPDGKRFFVFPPSPSAKVEIWDAERLTRETVIEIEMTLPKPNDDWAEAKFEEYLDRMDSFNFRRKFDKELEVPEVFPGIMHLQAAFDDTLRIYTGERYLDSGAEPLIYDFYGKKSRSEIPPKKINRVLGKINDHFLVAVRATEDGEMGVAFVKESELGAFLRDLP